MKRLAVNGLLNTVGELKNLRGWLLRSTGCAFTTAFESVCRMA
jgi:hypothetical protein